MRQFRRAWRIQVGTLLVSSSAPPGPGLACKFSVTKSVATARAGSLELEVYNLSRAHSAELADLPRRTTFVSVDAGYEEGMSRIFTGNLRRAIPRHDGASWVVKVTAGDGEFARRSARISRAFASGTSTSVAAQALADALGVGVGNAASAFRGVRLAGGGEVFEDGHILHGNAAQALTDLCNASGQTWTIQDGTIQVLPLGGASARTAIRLGADSGLIDSPEIVGRNTVTVKCLLQPGLVPGQRVVIDSLLVQHEVRITEAKLTGETHGNSWEAELTCHRPRAPLQLTGSGPLNPTV